MGFKMKELNELMSEEEFQDYLKEAQNYLRDVGAFSKFKSVKRAIKRGHIILGSVAPKRPFSNRGNTCKRKGKHSREFNELKKEIYGRRAY